MSVERISRQPTTLGSELEERQHGLVRDGEFTNSLLAHGVEAVEVLDLEGRIEFMSVSGLRAMEIDDGDAILAASWLALWPRAALTSATAAVAQAKAGKTATFEGTRPTARGKPKWWEVIVSPIPGAGGRPARLLVISRDATERKLAQQSRQKLTDDLHHRVKNIFARVLAITSQTLARAKSVAEGRLAVEQRLMALAEAHDLLRVGRHDGANLREIVSRAIQPYDAKPSRFTLAGDDVRLSAQAALALAMATHELCTNAFKYGALSSDAGRIDMSWRVDEARQLHLVWRESGGPSVQAPAGRGGFGTKVIEASFRGQFGGTATVSFEPSGIVWTVEAPLSTLQDAATAAGGRDPPA
jgi:two-component sensor histidine kinase